MPYYLKYLQDKPTLVTGNTSDLKIELPNRRVWLSRPHPERPDQIVTVEARVGVLWQTIEEYPAAEDLELTTTSPDQAQLYPKYRRLFLNTNAGTDKANALLDCLHLLNDPLSVDELKEVLRGRVEQWIRYQFKTDVYMKLLADLSARREGADDQAG